MAPRPLQTLQPSPSSPHEYRESMAGMKSAMSPSPASSHVSLPPTYNPKHNVGAVARALTAGGIAGAVSRTAVAPLERLKILQQVEGPGIANSPYATTWGGLRHMWREEGLRGWLRGNGSNCIRIVPNSAIKFVFYEALTDAIRAGGHHSASGVGDELSPLQRLGAGAVAGVVGMSATYPLDMVRGRLTVEGTSGRYRSVAHATRLIIREEGVMALYKGWLPSVLGVVPYMGLNFAVYATLKDRFVHASRDAALAVHNAAVARGEIAPDVVPKLPSSERDLTVTTRLACGAVAGACGQTVAFPFDVVRRRLQMVGFSDTAKSGAASASASASSPPPPPPPPPPSSSRLPSSAPSSGASPSPPPSSRLAPAATASAAASATRAASSSSSIPAMPRYTGMFDCFATVVREEGFGALWRGILPNYYKVVPSIAIAFVTYDVLKEMLDVEFKISA
ncbi:hypothetical protein PPROV_000030000 [Pycnococcus provasolii]|uniref:Mitochondrial carrier protein n=1 Tax=Pycnococcus provasolii TaxID=41880 RepID=A0A830H3G7_9CHLO|nr:hypothetical protein PPROV_000030000 [Pycnococcus provasolii]